MHMADALISTPVALTAGAVAASLLGVAGYKVNREKGMNSRIVPLMGVLGAFVFAAQMINFTIPGTERRPTGRLSYSIIRSYYPMSDICRRRIAGSRM